MWHICLFVKSFQVHWYTIFYGVMPYIKGASLQIKNIASKSSIRTCFRYTYLKYSSVESQLYQDTFRYIKTCSTMNPVLVRCGWISRCQMPHSKKIALKFNRKTHIYTLTVFVFRLTDFSLFRPYPNLINTYYAAPFLISSGIYWRSADILLCYKYAWWTKKIWERNIEASIGVPDP